MNSKVSSGSGSLPFTCLGKPVGPWGLGLQMVPRFQDWQISFQNRFYHLQKSVPFTGKRLRRPKTCIKIKDGFKKKRNTNLRWNIPSGKTGLHFQMFRCSRKFSAGTIQKVLFHLLSHRILRKLFVNGKKPLSYSKWRFPLKYCAGIEYVILIMHRV